MTNARDPARRVPSIAVLVQRLSGLERLLEVTRHVAADIDATKILQTIADEACVALDSERASLYQYDPAREELYTRVVTKLEIAEIRNGLDRGISGWVARNRSIANVAAPAADSRWNSTIDQATGFRTRNVLATPLTSPHDGMLLGVVEVINKRRGAFTRFDEELLEAFSRHAAVALDRMRLLDELRKRQEIEISLDVARRIQQSFMPHDLPQVPSYEMASWWMPNQAVGGDYCDVLRMPDGRTALVIADVSGHGLGPSLLMASVRAALRALVLSQASPDVLLSQLGRALAGDLRDGNFITIVLASIDPAGHTVEYANAGHAPAIHYSARRDAFAALEATGMPLGVMDEPEFPPAEPLQLELGDLLVLCTDGIVEAMDREDRQFGRRRLDEIIRTHRAAPVREIVREIGHAVEAHFAGHSPTDDLTVLAARRNR